MRPKEQGTRPLRERATVTSVQNSGYFGLALFWSRELPWLCSLAAALPSRPSALFSSRRKSGHNDHSRMSSDRIGFLRTPRGDAREASPLTKR